MKDTKNFMPISKKDLRDRNIDKLDFIIVTGDAYVDHPSFGTAVIGRVLEKEGFTVGVIAQPTFTDVNAFKVLGEPRLGFLINSGNIDSMVNHYTAAKKKRHDDFYSPGGKSGYRPDRAVIIYCNKVREAYKNIPIVIGGIEASLRRFAHYDYWSDKVRRSILIDSKADLLSYGMGEKSIAQIAKYLNFGKNIKNITGVRGTCYITNNIDKVKDYLLVPSYEEVIADKEAYNEAFKIQSKEHDAIYGKTLVQKHGERYIVQNPPSYSMTEEEMDQVYALPYARDYHPIYEALGGVPAIKEIKFSLISQRGCYGSCSFCALTFHQGRVIQNRSQDSIIDEAKELTTLSDFKGYINDVGGPTANFRNKACTVQDTAGVCKHRECIFPTPCKNLKIDHSEYLSLLRRLRNIPKVKKVFVRSGIRYDYLIYDKNPEFLKELSKHHISGQLKVAPEHINDTVLKNMGKPSKEIYNKFSKKFYEVNEKLGLKQYLVPYLMSSHPGSDLNAAIELAEFIKEMGYMPEQVQDFYPTPGSLSTTIYYTGVNPFTKEEVYVPKKAREKAMQRALLQFSNPANYNLVKEALLLAGREDLIGGEKRCLIPQNKPIERKNNRKKDNKPLKSGFNSCKNISGTINPEKTTFNSKGLKTSGEVPKRKSSHSKKSRSKKRR